MKKIIDKQAAREFSSYTELTNILNERYEKQINNLQEK